MKLAKASYLLLGVVLFFAVVILVGAQDQKETKKARQDRVSGTIQMINKDTKTITVRGHDGGMQRQVVYSDETKITNLNKPGGSLDDLKEGTRVICIGKFNEKSQLAATRIDIRLPK